ncbi:DEKNAAC105173 [Brettanomyces naardenensis]|uniref:DEKNAAC105173 n=1 Tax=Brettanomyces naardenensis TaxID=13370 RepID=A0A448YT20_BRENA|nr:DEKNAAC105173 [Brettanomyces naardenensis]
MTKPSEESSQGSTVDAKKSYISKLPNEITKDEIDDTSDFTQEKVPAKLGFSGRFAEFRDSFKRFDLGELDPNLSDLEKANIIASRSPLQRKLKSRHIQMIAIGGAIGTGLFVGSGTALASGGPASLIISYLLTGIMIFCTVQALGELAVAFPVAGSFLSMCSRFVSPAWGFVISWNYAMQWLIVMPLELVAASLTINYWHSNVSPAVWVTIFYVCILVVNIFGVKGYGEVEYWLSVIKVIAIVGFCILGIILNCGGGPKGGYIGGKFYHNPGAFNHGFKGLCAVFVTAAFSFAGTELVGLASAETENPSKTLPSASKQVVWRIFGFYLISLTIVGLLVPYNDPRLLTANSLSATASPFVISIENAGISVLPSIFNAVILISLISVANSAVFGCSRTIASLADQGFAPKIFGYIDRMGRPIMGIALSMLVGLICYLSVSPKESEAFAWLMALSGLSSVITWATICLSHIRFRQAMKAQGRSIEELSFTALSGVAGSWFGLGLNVVVLGVQFWVALFPLGGKPNPTSFFENYLNSVVNVALFAFYLLWKRRKSIIWIHAKDMDLTTGRRDVDIELVKQERAEQKAFMASKPWWYRTYKFWC